MSVKRKLSIQTMWQHLINGWLRARKICFVRIYRQQEEAEKNISKGKMGKSIKLTTDIIQYIENLFKKKNFLLRHWLLIF